MTDWRKTGCILCAQNCGLEILVEDGRMVKVRPDRDNPRSKGYACRKGMKILNYQYPTVASPPLSSGWAKVSWQISWDQATSEIAAKMRNWSIATARDVWPIWGPVPRAGILKRLSACRCSALWARSTSTPPPARSSAAPGGCSAGCWENSTTSPFPMSRKRKCWSAGAGTAWRAIRCPQAPRVLTEIAKNPDKLLVIIDPRKSETARLANIHLAVRPGTDALLLKAMIAIILERGWENTGYLEDHVEGFAANPTLVCRLRYRSGPCRLPTRLSVRWSNSAA